jgi:hypothetical protein
MLRESMNGWVALAGGPSVLLIPLHFNTVQEVLDHMYAVSRRVNES